MKVTPWFILTSCTPLLYHSPMAEYCVSFSVCGLWCFSVGLLDGSMYHGTDEIYCGIWGFMSLEGRGGRTRCPYYCQNSGLNFGFRYLVEWTLADVCFLFRTPPRQIYQSCIYNLDADVNTLYLYHCCIKHLPDRKSLIRYTLEFPIGHVGSSVFGL